MENLLNKTKTEQLLEIESNKLNELSTKYAEMFPDHENWLLPTTFGNAIRAFEIYPRVMYGIEAIQGWDRLQAVISKDFRDLVDTSKTQTDMWVNFWILSLIFFGIYLFFTLFTGYFILWAALVAFIAPWVASRQAVSSAIGWGEMVKASFDVFLPELRTKLGYEANLTPELEREFWEQYSAAIIYRLPDTMPRYNKKRPNKS